MTIQADIDTRADCLIKNVHLATQNPTLLTPYGGVVRGVVAVREGKILWAGAESDAPAFKETSVVDGGGRWLTPGLIDCHTHLVYAGDRAQEFEWRLKGESYIDIARKGGGIHSTVTATRDASEGELFKAAAPRLSALLREGVTTVEIKSGYGLEPETELRLLRVARELEKRHPVTIRTTFLGAHTLPKEFENQADNYIDLVVDEMLPRIAEAGLADAVDVFCENIGFSVDQCRRVLAKAKALGLPVKGHVEQLSYLAGARLVAELEGLSVDHLEYLPPSDVAFLKQHNIVAVLLPGAFYFLQETQKPPIEAMRDAKLPIAVASDLNPGSSPMASLLLAMNQACVLFKLTPEEALTGVTRHAAQALGLSQQKGQIRTGWDADLVLWDIQHPAELSYGINMHRPESIWVNGHKIEIERD